MGIICLDSLITFHFTEFFQFFVFFKLKMQFEMLECVKVCRINKILWIQKV